MTSADILIILDFLGINYHRTSKRVCFPCPLHNGDNPTALSILLDEPIGVWRCFTRGCEEKFGKSFLGFLRAYKSVQDGREWSNEQTKHWIKSIIGEFTLHNSNEFNIIAHKYVIPNLFQMGSLSREQVRQKLQIPSPFFIKKGYSSDILDKYDVGLCTSQKSMRNRSVVPIYDLSHNFIGATARSIYDKCNNCKLYHDIAEECSTNQFVNASRHKWKHSANFKAGSYLYNLWYAYPLLQETKCAILVESPGNVWRLEEAGIHNALALLGSSISNEQLAILDHFGVMTIITLFDNDEAGHKCKERVRQLFYRRYNIISIDLPQQYNDVGEMSIIDIHKFILPKTLEIY